MLTARQKLIYGSILFLVVAGFTEGLSLLTTWQLTRRGWMSYVPQFDDAKINAVLAARDPKLGWGVPGASREEHGALTANYGTSVGANAKLCASFYGDSFTLGAGEKANYPFYVGESLSCAVANFGVGGFGSDQAELLFERQVSRDPAPVVVLSHVTENILRNVNQYRNFLYPGSDYVFKPRYHWDGTVLSEVPIPVNSVEDFKSVENDPARLLIKDSFAERPRPSFPYFFSLFRWIVTDYHVRSWLSKVPRHREFYSPDHASGALPLTVEILSRFVRTAEEHHKRAVLVTIPTCPDLRFAKKTGEWSDQYLIDRLRDRGFQVVHGGPALLAQIGKGDILGIYDDCSGHLNEKGYRLLAQAVYEQQFHRKP